MIDLKERYGLWEKKPITVTGVIAAVVVQLVAIYLLVLFGSVIAGPAIDEHHEAMRAEETQVAQEMKRRIQNETE